MDIILVPLLHVISYVLNLCVWVIFIDVLISWLVLADVIRTKNRLFYLIVESIGRFADFCLEPIRQRLPYIRGIDVSPVVFMLGAIFLNNVIYRILIRFI